MSMVVLFGKLRKYELELGRLNNKEEERKKKHITFKYEISKSKDQVEEDDSNYESMNLMIKKKFINFMKNKNRGCHKIEWKKGIKLSRKKN